MTTDYRALCAELLAALDAEALRHPEMDGGLLRREARIALAQPEAIRDRIAEADAAIEASMNRIRSIAAPARAALAQPEPVGATELTDDELLRCFRIATPCINKAGWQRELDGMRAAIAADRARWGRPTITPIPVSERLPGPEDCAPWPDEPGANHWCWLGQKDESGWHWAQASAMGMDADQLEWSLAGGGWTHFLPHWALLVPTAVDAPGT